MADGPTRPRVIAIAESANPEMVSVPLVGWNQLLALREVVDLHFVTQIRNREAILRSGLREGVDFTILDTEPLARPLWKFTTWLRGGNATGFTTATAGESLVYYYFEHLFWKQFGARIRSGEFDVVHRIIPLSPSAPSIVASRCKRAGVPFVVGPLNGGMPFPPGYGDIRTQEKEWLSYLRRAVRLMPGYRATRRDAAAIIVASRVTHSEIPQAHRAKCVYIPENGIDPAALPARPNTGAPGAPLTVACVGRLVPGKVPELLLDAMTPMLEAGRARLEFIGDGPLREGLEATVGERELGGAVLFRGRIPHADVLARLSEVDVLGFPSIRDFGGGAVLEAMAAGAVPVVVDYGGPPEIVSARCGVRVELGPRDVLTARLRSALEGLERDREGLRRMSAAARRRATLFSWSAKARQTLEVYRWVMGVREGKPDFGMPFADPPGSLESGSSESAGADAAGAREAGGAE